MSDLKTITIKASGSLQKQIPAGTTVNGVHTVGEAMSRLTIPEGWEFFMMVNGKMANWDTPLEDGDVLQLVPAISGGHN